MISQVLIQLQKKFPYHYSIEDDHIRIVILISESLHEKEMEALDFVEELGFGFHSKTDLSPATGGIYKKWSQMEYHMGFVQEKLPPSEEKFLKRFKSLSEYERTKLITQ